MNATLYPNLLDFAGFGWVLPTRVGRIRVVGRVTPALMRVEMLDEARPRRSWDVPLNHPVLQPLAAELAARFRSTP